MNDVVCVWVGDKYDEKFVTNLYHGIKKHTTTDFRFNVITNHAHISKTIPCRIIPIPNWNHLGVNIMHHRKAWWFKMWMFNPEHKFSKNTLYFDLDVVIIRNIDKFFSYSPKQFCILQDFNRQFIKDYKVCNSSIMKFNSKRHSDLWYEFDQNKEHYMQCHRGDQDYITKYYEDRNIKHRSLWPREWAMSWKWEIEKGGKRNNGTDRNSWYHPDKPYVIPDDCSVVVCHGDPKPSEIECKFVKKNWINSS